MISFNRGILIAAVAVAAITVGGSVQQAFAGSVSGLVAVGDFDADGDSDILLKNNDNDSVATWLLEDLNIGDIISATSLASSVGTSGATSWRGTKSPETTRLSLSERESVGYGNRPLSISYNATPRLKMSLFEEVS